MRKIGLMLIGVSGANASALIVGLDLYKKSKIKKESINLGMLTEQEQFDHLDLIPPENIEISGWDIKPSSPLETCKEYKIFSNPEILNFLTDIKPIQAKEAIILETDYVFNEGNFTNKVDNYLNLIEQIRTDIKSFKNKYNLDNVIVLNISSPHKNIEIEEWHNDLKIFKQNLAENHPKITSGMLYCLASIYENSPFIDFTPSATLIPNAIIEEAINYNVPIAGRDGSTGQTLIKSVMGPMFNMRNFHVDGWYSTNVLGNQDGYVLSKDSYNESKIHDKRQGLKKILGYDFEHIIDIKYFPPKGDSKEAWDLIEFRGWLDESMSLRINWIGKDSILAAPLILDLTRLMDFSTIIGSGGLQPHLGIFFKNPLGTKERNYFILYDNLTRFYENC